MSKIIYRMTSLWSCVVKGIPIGTNRGLFHLLWMLLSGRLLRSRGAVIPGLAAGGLPDEGVRRAWAALAYGRGESHQLLAAWRPVVPDEGRWAAPRHGGSRPVAGALVGFYRPRRRACPPKHYSAQAGKARAASPVGLAAGVGSVGQQRLALPRLLVRAALTAPSEAAVPARLLQQTQAGLAPDEAVVTDRGLPLAQLQAAGRTRSVARGPGNCTACRAALPPDKGHGRRPTRGALVRPLPRRRQDQVSAATAPDREETWQVGTAAPPLAVRAECWDPLLLPDATPGAPTFNTVVLHDPRFAEPVLWHTPVPLTGAQLQAFSLDRWPGEGRPLTAQQMLGAARQCVFAPESRPRLPALVLRAGSSLSSTAAPQPALPTGFWARAPKPTSGRLRRVLAQGHCAELVELPPQLRKKHSPTAHLPKGVLGHRRQKKTSALPQALPLAA